MKKIKLIICIICSLFVIHILYDTVKQSYYFKQTENIYQEFERVFGKHDYINCNNHLKTDVENIEYDISKYGDNYKSKIKRISNSISGNKGYLKYYIEITYYDSNGIVICNQVYYDDDVYILVKKVNGIWEVYDICSSQGYHDRLMDGNL